MIRSVSELANAQLLFECWMRNVRNAFFMSAYLPSMIPPPLPLPAGDLFNFIFYLVMSIKIGLIYCRKFITVYVRMAFIFENIRNG